MLEKIGLPAKPSLRGSNWVVDASHCQGCSSQFTFINRKHHCRRCGGLFCNSCTQQRMVLRGQGDSAVRICESCKKLEEAARFEMRQGRRAGRGSLKSAPSNEDEVLSQILGLDREQSSSSQRSSSNTKAAVNEDDGDLQKIVSDEKPNDMRIDVASSNPDDLRQQALEEKRKYKILKADRKPDEALRAFKRGKELERQADALEVHLRKIRKKILPSGKSDMQNKDFQIESVRKTKSLSHMGKEKDDLTAELRELGWSDMELHSEDKKSANLSLEGELSSLIGEISPNTGKEKGSGIDKTEVVALKKKALMLKREGKPAEAKEELKKAKLLEKQLEEQELLAEADDSDDELSALIRSMDNNKEEFSLHNNKHDLDLGHLVGISDDLLDDNFEVTDQDMMDPEIAAALESIGWTEDSGHPENIFSESQPLDREALLSEIQSLKREALAQKRLGNTAEAMAFLKKAKLLEKDLNSSGSQENDTMVQSASSKGVSSQVSGSSINNAASMPTPKSRLMIQKELLSLKKKALTLRREGKLTEAEEELRKGAALERQLEEMDKASNLKASQVNIGGDFSHSANKHPDILKDLPPGKEGEDDVTDQDMSDPAYLSLLKDLGWNDENNELSYSSNKPSNKDSDHSVPINEASPNNHLISISVGATRRSKSEIQRELLGLKRKALALRREGKIEDAEDVLKMAKDLEACMAEVEAPKKEVQVEATRFKDKLLNHPDECAVEEGGDEVVTEEDMHDPALHSMLINIGWKDEEHQLVAIKGEPVKEAASSSKNTLDLPVLNSSSGIPGTASRSKGEIQRELLVLKRKALAHRRKGEMEEAEEFLKMAKKLEDQIEDFGTHKKDESPVLSESSAFQNKHGNREIVTELDKGSALSGSLIPPTSQLPDDMHLSSVEVGASGKNPAEHIKAAEISVGYTIKTQDLLTADSWSSSDILTQKQRDLKLSSEKFSQASPPIHLNSSMTQKQRDLKLSSEKFSQASPPIHLDSSMTFNQEQGGKNNILTQKKGDLIVADEKPSGPNAAVQDYASQHLVCKNNISTQKKGDLIVADEKPSGPNAAVQDYASQHLVSFHQEILAHKRKAVSLKREGKLAEAREELRQAKLLEKSLENGNVQSTTAPTVSSDASHVVEKKQNSPPIAAKPLSGRDRFKLQQESLAHKRQALKLRREGRMEEAEAEFEQAKALETQLEELAVQDSSSKSDTVDDVTVEDFLDPLLLSALKAVGLDDVSAVSRGLERQEPAKPDVAKTELSDQERVQLVERIKAEKLKAVNLKRSGKQAEALDALRRAKLYEKKLNSLTSG